VQLGLDQRTVIVTGGSNGIGAAVARAFGAEGAHVVVAYHHNVENAQRVADDVCDAGGTSQVSPYALEDAASARSLVQGALSHAGRVDVVVANAVRWWSRSPDGFEGVPEEAAEAVVCANLLGAVRLSRAVAPVMRRQSWGRMVLMSTNLAVDGLAGAEYYTAAKAGLHGLNQSLAWSLGPAGVLVNVVMPGLTMTDRNAANFPPSLKQTEIDRTPMGRLVVPEDVADAVVFLCSEANRGITGEVISVTGGR
jgi:3-oxoacyl-[acyl-carrier protein] reductase